MSGREPLQRSRKNWLWGQNEQADRIRSYDWQQTPLGPGEHWPQSLLSAVEIMLASPQPAVVCWGPALTMLYNDAEIALLGPRHPDALGKTFREVMADQWDDLQSILAPILAGNPQHGVRQRVRPGDPASWYTFSWTPLRDEEGAVAGFYTVATETTLRLGDEPLRTILQNTREAVSMLDLASGKYVFLSPAHAALTGFSIDEIQAFSVAEIQQRVHPDDREKFGHHTQWAASVENPAPIEFRWRIKSGEYRWFSNNRRLVRDPQGNPIATVNVSRDITETKNTEQALRVSETRLSLAVETAGLGTWEWDIASDQAIWNPKLYALLGIAPDEPASSALFFAAVHPDDLDRVKDNLTGVFNEGEEWHSEFRVIWPNGTVHWLIGQGRLFRHTDGTPKTMIGVNYDNTERKNAELALRMSEARLALAVDSAQMGIWEWDIQANTAIWNSKLFEVLGLMPHPAADAGVFFERVHPDDRLSFKQGLDDVIANGEDWQAEFRVIRPDGGERWLFGAGRLFRNLDGSPRTMFGINYDITDRKKAEERLRESQTSLIAMKEQLIFAGRAHELGQVSSGIAHELNQPLAAMHNYAATAKRLISRGDTEGAHKLITKAGEQASRAGEIIRRMRDFVEKRSTNRRPDDANAILREAAALGLIGTKAQGIECRFLLAPEIPSIIVDRAQLEQVLINLLNNAIDAMASTPTKVLSLSSRYDGEFVEIAVTDTGHGIPPRVFDRLFESFVTTKPQGMGIGLAISKSIIEAHGGEITAEPNPGGGTCFRLRLPTSFMKDT